MKERRQSIAETAPTFSRVVISTGNALNPSNPMPTADSSQSLSQEISRAIQVQDIVVEEGLVTVGFGQKQPLLPQTSDSRDEYVCSVKLFLMDNDPKHIRTAVEWLDKRIAHHHVDMFVLSSPILSLSDETTFHTALEQLRKPWISLEAAKARGEIAKLGIADLDLPKLQEFLRCICGEPVESVVHLDILQIPSPWGQAIHATTADGLDKKLVQLAKQHKVTVLTHHDPSPIITNDAFAEMLGLERGQIKIEWVLRFTGMVQNRGVLSQRGYIVSGVRT